MAARYTKPGEVKVWRFCIPLGGPMVPKEEGRLARFVGDPVWRYRDGFVGTEEAQPGGDFRSTSCRWDSF
jgi:hypothetical protein